MSMRQSLTAVIERNATLSEAFTTEPYEAGWASEARWFVRTDTLTGDQALVEFTTQISPDGLIWCDWEGPALEVSEEGLMTLPVREFGNWLRLRGAVKGTESSAKVTIYLALKA